VNTFRRCASSNRGWCVNIEEKCILMSQDGAGVTQVYYLRGPRKLNEERRTTHIEVSINTSLLQCGLGLKEFVSAGLNILSHHQGERSKQPLAQHDKQLFHNRQHNINTPHPTPAPLSPDQGSCEDKSNIRISIIVKRSRTSILPIRSTFGLAVRQGLAEII
jgi:hypothetical protein